MENQTQENLSADERRKQANAERMCAARAARRTGEQGIPEGTLLPALTDADYESAADFVEGLPQTQQTQQSADVSVSPVAGEPKAKVKTQESVPGHYDYVMNPETDQYEKTFIPDGSNVIGVSDMVEPLDLVHTPLDLGESWDKGRGRDMHAYWAHNDPQFHNNERRNGYVPVRPENLPPDIRARLQVVKHPSLGTVVAHGDVVLMELPRVVYDRREQRKRDMQMRDEQARRDMSQGSLGEIASEINSAYGKEVVSFPGEVNYSRRSYEHVDGQDDSDVQNEVDSIQEAQDYVRARETGRSTFGQLTGPMDQWERNGPYPVRGYTAGAAR